MYPTTTLICADNPTVLSKSYTDQCTAARLPVNGGDPDLYATMLRLVVPVAAGDLVDAQAYARVTNDLGYNVGVGWHFWTYDVDVPEAQRPPWTRVSPLCGENVTPDMHHMPLTSFCTFQVPADWVPGHRMTVVFRVNCASTAWQPGACVTADPAYAAMSVSRYVPGLVGAAA